MEKPGFLYQDILNRHTPEDDRNSRNERIGYVLAIIVTVVFSALLIGNPLYILGRLAGVDWNEVESSIRSQAVSAEQLGRESNAEIKEAQQIPDDFMRRAADR